MLVSMVILRPIQLTMVLNHHQASRILHLAPGVITTALITKGLPVLDTTLVSICDPHCKPARSLLQSS